ncbi:hypothetical protein DdX_21062 [Ditylenchus destructor]|uniref:Uncharacterized protein n=1 Tax=Ditylenchus destructor TaxID=166010 RepID=A0AAD4MHV2_9BILA|nr:hypothetical protein DdX_21062 [Ditylenchus destructor]
MVQIQPRFPHQLWNVHHRTIEGKHRNNNYAEAGNRRIQSEMGMETPTMGYFIDRLKLIQRGRDQAHEFFTSQDRCRFRLMLIPRPMKDFSDFRLENTRTNEVLELKRISHKEANDVFNVDIIYGPALLLERYTV